MFISQLENSDKLHCSSFFCFFFFFQLFSFWCDYWTNNNIAGKFKYCKHRTSTEAHVARRGQKTPTQAALTAFFFLLLLHWLLNLLQPADKLLSLPVPDARFQHPHDWLLWRGEQTDESASYTWHKYLEIEWLFMLYWRSNWKPRAAPSGLPGSQYYVCVKQNAGFSPELYIPLGLLRDRWRMEGWTLFPAGEAFGLPGQQKSLRGATASPAKSLVDSQS